MIIIFVIKNSFRFLRPIFDEYFSNQTISDVLIFAFTLIVSYILLSFIKTGNYRDNTAENRLVG